MMIGESQLLTRVQVGFKARASGNVRLRAAEMLTRVHEANLRLHRSMCAAHLHACPQPHLPNP